MNKNIFIFRERSGGFAEITPSKYPAQYKLSFEGNGAVSYGENGGPPSHGLVPGHPTIVTITHQFMQLSYQVLDGKLEWQEME